LGIQSISEEKFHIYPSTGRSHHGNRLRLLFLDDAHAHLFTKASCMLLFLISFSAVVGASSCGECRHLVLPFLWVTNICAKPCLSDSFNRSTPATRRMAAVHQEESSVLHW
jgi:hypothetical protein